MKKILLFVAVAFVAMSANAGGLLHNTNQHIAFQRMMARGASHEIDAVYTNPLVLLLWSMTGGRSLSTFRVLFKPATSMQR